MFRICSKFDRPYIGTRLYAINLIKFSKKYFSHIYVINLTLKLLSALINVSITTQMINVENMRCTCDITF